MKLKVTENTGRCIGFLAEAC